MKSLVRYIAVLSLAGWIGSAQAIPLTDLFAGQSTIAGDMRFDNFSLVSSYSSSGHIYNTNNIEVTPLNDGGLDSGLRFDILNDEFLLYGDGGLTTEHFQFEFRVTPLDPAQKLIKGVSMNLEGVNLVAADPLINWNWVNIIEFVGSLPGGVDLARITTQAFTEGHNPSLLEAFDSADFTAVNEIWVTKGIHLESWRRRDSAELLAFEQRFSQVDLDPEPMPAPASLTLFGLGLAGLGWSRRKKV